MSEFTGLPLIPKASARRRLTARPWRFANTTYGYAVIPNANLKSERSNSFELGMKFKTNAPVRKSPRSTTVTATSSTALKSVPPLLADAPIIQYQYQNLDHVKTYGAEASAAYKFLPGWQVSGRHRLDAR